MNEQDNGTARKCNFFADTVRWWKHINSVSHTFPISHQKTTTLQTNIHMA